jgi:glutamate/tyrosine decarboxylase-like PLP-dependent enzyme
MSGVIYISGQTHLSVAKGLRVLGFVERQIRKVLVDSKFRLNVESLEGIVQADCAKGLLPFAVERAVGLRIQEVCILYMPSPIFAQNV